MMTVITGGSGSGKSEYAENLLTALEPGRRVYIATMQPFDAECRKRIERHRLMRAEKRFRTIECYAGLKRAAGQEDLLQSQDGLKPSVLLECMSNLVANEMYRDDGAGDRTVEEVIEGVKALKEKANHFVIVTNEVFSDGIAYDPETAKYIRFLGQINQRIAAMADNAAESVCGIPVYLKGAELCSHHL